MGGMDIDVNPPMQAFASDGMGRGGGGHPSSYGYPHPGAGSYHHHQPSASTSSIQHSPRLDSHQQHQRRATAGSMAEAVGYPQTAAPGDIDMRRFSIPIKPTASNMSGSGAMDIDAMEAAAAAAGVGATRSADVKLKGREPSGDDDDDDDDRGTIGGHSSRRGGAGSPDKGPGEKERKRPGGGAGIGAANEFTKRKNWSQRVIEEIQDFLHVLSPNGLFIFASPSIIDLCGYRAEDLIGRSIVDFIHIDDREAYTRSFNEALTTRSELGLFARFRKKDDRYIIFEITYVVPASTFATPAEAIRSGHPHFVAPKAEDPSDQSTSGPKDESGGQICKCFFAVGRPYPSKNAAMLDSFLDLKIENEKLRSKLEVVYKDIEAEGGLRSLGALKVGSDGTINPASSSYGGGAGSASGAYPVDGQGSPTGSNFDPSIGLVPTTGLYPSSGNTYGALGIGVSQSHRGSVTGREDAGSADGGGPPAAASARTGAGATTAAGDDKKKVKKPKVDDGEFVCRDCGTVDSPEWRKGPDGRARSPPCPLLIFLADVRCSQDALQRLRAQVG